MLQCGMRADTSHHRLQWGDTKIMKDSSGVEYIEVKERLTKTRRGDKKDKIPVKRIYGNSSNPERCPLQAYKKYMRQRPANYIQNKNMRRPDAPFYIATNTKPTWELTEIDPWFIAEAMGVNKIGSLCKMMARRAGIDVENRNISNHSMRKTMVQTLSDCNVPPTMIMQVSGHRNVASINNYSKMNERQHREIRHHLIHLGDMV